MQQNWLGLRPEDLTDGDRTSLERDLQLSAVHRAELNFGGQLENLPYLGRVIVLDDVRNYSERMGPFSEKRRDKTWLYGLPLVLVVIIMVVSLALSNKGARDPVSVTSFLTNNSISPSSDLTGEPLAVSLTVWADQSTGERPVTDGQEIQRAELLVLEVHVQGSGHVVIGEVYGGDRLYPLKADSELFFADKSGVYRVGPRDRPKRFGFPENVSRVQLRAYFCGQAIDGFPASTPPGCQSADFNLSFTD